MGFRMDGGYADSRRKNFSVEKRTCEDVVTTLDLDNVQRRNSMRAFFNIMGNEHNTPQRLAFHLMDRKDIDVPAAFTTIDKPIIEQQKRETASNEPLYPKTLLLAQQLREIQSRYAVIDESSALKQAEKSGYYLVCTGGENGKLIIISNRGRQTFIIHHNNIIREEEGAHNRAMDLIIGLSVSDLMSMQEGGLVAVIKRFINETIFSHRLQEELGKKNQNVEDLQQLIEGIDKQPAPAGWMTVKQMQTTFCVSEKTIIEEAGDFKPKIYLNARALPCLFYSPEVALKIKAFTEALPKIPQQGWVTFRKARKLMGINLYYDEKMQDYIEENQQTEDEVQTFRVNGVATFCMTQDLLDRIIKAKKEHEVPPPEGWMNMWEIRKKLQELGRPSADDKIEQQILVVAQENSLQENDYKQTFWKQGHQYVYYSPNIFTLIFEKLNQLKFAPLGWEAESVVARYCGPARYRKIIEQMALEKGVDVVSFKKRHLTANGLEADFLSPEIIAEIRSKIGQGERVKRDPNIWFSATRLKEILVREGYAIGQTRVQQLANEIAPVGSDLREIGSSSNSGQGGAAIGTTAFFKKEVLEQIKARLLAEGKIRKN